VLAYYQLIIEQVDSRKIRYQIPSYAIVKKAAKFNDNCSTPRRLFIKYPKWWQNSMTITQLQDKNTLSNTSLQLVKKVAKTQQQLLNSTNIDSHHQITSLQIVKKGSQNQGDHIVI